MRMLTLFCFIPMWGIWGVLFGGQVLADSDSWPQFRGQAGTGVAAQAQPATEWNLEQNQVWKTSVPGVGWSSPVTKDGRIWLTTAIAAKATDEQIEAKRKGVTEAGSKTVAASVELRAICVDVDTGKMLHNRLLRNVVDPEMINPLNSYASPTPAIGGGKVVCHFGSYGTWCLDSESGNIVWEVKYVVDHSVGPGSSPVIDGSNVLLVCDGIDKQFVACVDLNSGKQKWLTPRPELTQPNLEYRKSYSTPYLVEIDGKRQAVIPAAQWVVSYDPETGAEHWRAFHGQGFSIAPMPVMQNGLLVFSTGYIKPEFVAIDPTGSGDVTETHIKWRSRGSSTMPSFIATGGQIISISEKGILSRLDAANGTTLERIRIGGNHSASPIYANGHLYFSSRDGVVSVVKNGQKFSTVSTNKFDHPILASPAVYGDDLIFRTEKGLYRIRP